MNLLGLIRLPRSPSWASSFSASRRRPPPRGSGTRKSRRTAGSTSSTRTRSTRSGSSRTTWASRSRCSARGRTGRRSSRRTRRRSTSTTSSTTGRATTGRAPKPAPPAPPTLLRWGTEGELKFGLLLQAWYITDDSPLAIPTGTTHELDARQLHRREHVPPAPLRDQAQRQGEQGRGRSRSCSTRPRRS